MSKQNAQISDVWAISPRITNEVRLGYTNQLNFFSPLTLGLGYPGKIGWKFAKSDNFPDIQIKVTTRVAMAARYCALNPTQFIKSTLTIRPM